MRLSYQKGYLKGILDCMWVIKHFVGLDLIYDLKSEAYIIYMLSKVSQETKSNNENIEYFYEGI